MILEASREELWRLYKLANEERQTEQRLQWERAKHFFLVNVLLLLGIPLAVAPPVQQAALLFTAASALFAAYSLHQGNVSRRKSAERLEAIEAQLELGSLGSRKEPPMRAWNLLLQMCIALLALYLLGAPHD